MVSEKLAKKVWNELTKEEQKAIIQNRNATRKSADQAKETKRLQYHVSREEMRKARVANRLATRLKYEQDLADLAAKVFAEKAFDPLDEALKSLHRN